ncbi:MAG: response regulator [bacterium]|nr:response regulator [bacterium]
MTEDRKKILLVDDDKFLLDMYTVKFKEASFDITPAFSGEEALEKLKGGLVPDIILFDLIMPGLSGMEFLEEVIKNKYAEHAALVVLSNQGQKTDIEEAKRLGVDGYIVKANTIPSEVLDQVVEILKRKQK